MKRLLKIEWKKIFYYKSTKTFSLIYFLLLVIIGLILAFYKPTVGGLKLDFAKLGTFNFPDVWKNISYAIAIAKIFIGIIIITNVTNEYTYGTLKQNLIDGLTKKEFIKSKVLSHTLFAILSTIFVFIIALSLGLAFSKTDGSIWEGVEFIGAYFLKLSLFFAICLFISILLKKSGFAFLGLIILWMGEKVLALAEYLVLASKYGGMDEVPKEAFRLAQYLPMTVSANLIEFPDLIIQGFILGGTIFNFKTLDWTYPIAAVFYTVLFIVLSYRLLKKRDL